MRMVISTYSLTPEGARGKVCIDRYLSEGMMYAPRTVLVGSAYLNVLYKNNKQHIFMDFFNFM
jgi:hypothetical protein